MRRDGRFHVLVFCMAVLTFSLPFVTYAQQNSVPVGAETAAAQDANAMRFEAKVAAERDASSDINQLLWFGAGVGTLAAGCLVPAVVISIAPSAPPPEASGLMPFLDINFNGCEVIGGCVGCVVGLILPIRAIYKYQSPPPPERLIGKSPEYVEFYTDAYMAKSRSLRTQWAAAGGLIGVGVVVGVGFLSSLWTSDL